MFSTLRGAHLVGGELFYRCIGENQYEITLKIYRDCAGIGAPFDPLAKVGIFNAIDNSEYTTMLMAFPGSDTVPLNDVSGCLTLPPNLCLEAAFYVDTITLPPIIGGYNIVYQRCCRNPTIVNLVNPGSTGSTYISYIPMVSVVSCTNDTTCTIDSTLMIDTNSCITDTTCIIDTIAMDTTCSYDTICNYDSTFNYDTNCIITPNCIYDTMCNSSPYFNNFPPVVLCINDVINFDHSATDLDGDSLVYEFARPFHGGEWFDPAPDPSPPPFPNVVWEAGYSDTYQMSTAPPLSLDPNTGLLTGTTAAVGQFVVCIIVKEYRNGVYISETRRDFQFNVVICAVTKSAIADQDVLCDDYSVQFNNNSSNGNSFIWDFGDTSTLADTSNLMEPQYNYPDSGEYTVRLIVNPNTVCADTAFSVFRVYPRIQPNYIKPNNQCFVGHTFDFQGMGDYQPTTSFTWEFGPNASIDSSNNLNPTGITFDTSGYHLVTLTYRDYGCEKVFFDSILINNNPESSFFADSASWCDSGVVEFTNTSPGGTSNSYFWDYGDPAILSDTSTSFSTSYVYNDSGTYLATLMATSDSGCTGTYDSLISITPIIYPIFTVPPAQCFFQHAFDFNADGVYFTNTNITWNFGPNATPDSSSNQNPTGVTFDTTGVYPITVTYSDYGCIKTLVDSIEVSESANPSFTIDSTFWCTDGVITFTNSSTSNVSATYFWDFGDPSIQSDTSVTYSPAYFYGSPGTYNVSLTATTDSGCVSVADSMLTIYPRVIPTFSNVTDQCFQDHEYDFTIGGTYYPSTSFSWTFSPDGIPATSTSNNPTGVTFADFGTKNIDVTVSDYGCTYSSSTTVNVFQSPVAIFDLDTNQYCGGTSIQFTNESEPTSNTYLWSFGDGEISDQTNPLHTYTDSGEYYVSLIATTPGGCADTAILARPINIYPFPIAGFNPQSTTILIIDPFVSFTDLSEGASIIEFSTGDGTIYNNFGTIGHEYQDVGAYETYQIVQNQYGCTDTAYGTVLIEGGGDYFYVPNTFTPNGDGKNEIFIPILYRVPKDYSFAIYDRWGIEVFKTNSVSQGWDGRIKGNEIGKTDTYQYVIRYVDVENERIEHIGHVNLLK